jgi:iron complex outermembrane receptor protein
MIMLMQKTSLDRAAVYILALLFLIGSAGPAPALAQDANEQNDYFNMSLQDLMEVEVETVYSASKYQQKVTEAPSSITIITADEIDKYGCRTLADALRSVRGLYATYDRNYTYLGVRGFGRPGDYNSRILLLVDGRRVNDSVYDAAYFGGDFILDVDLIERVEVIRGPGSSLYGSNAFFAVINVITKNAAAFDGFEVSGEVASHDTHKERASYGKEFDSGLETVVSFSNFDSKGQNLYFREFDAPATNRGVARHADNEDYYNMFAKASYGDFTLESAYVRREKRIPTAPWGTVFNDNRSQTDDRTGFVDLRYDHEYKELGQVAGRIFYGWYNYDGEYVYPEPYVNDDGLRSYWYGADLQFTKELFSSHKLIWGAEYQDNDKQDQSNHDKYGVYLNDARESERWGIYIQDEFRISDNLIFNAGIRHDEYSTFGGTTNPRLGLIYEHTPETILKLLYGEAFRAPSAYELYYNDGGWSQKANSDLKPETIDTYELVVERRLRPGLWGSVTGFIYEIEDLISLGTDPLDSLSVFRNSDKVKAKGLEFGLDGKWENGCRTRASFSLVRTRDESTHGSLDNSPKHLGRVNLTAPLVKDRVFAGLELQYCGKRKTLTGHHTDAAFITNLTILGKELAKGLDVSFSLYNLFDEEYGHPGFSEHTQDIIYQDGRTFGVQLTYRF